MVEFNFAGYNNLSEGALHEVFPLLVSEVAATVLILQISLRRISAASPEPVPILASTRIPFDCDDADCSFVLKY